jgi:SAM-dependent methyltransferase
MNHLLRCPGCRGALTEAFHCPNCARAYPSVAGIPVLVADPDAEIANWTYRLDDFVRDNTEVRAKILAELATEARLAGTRRRLELLHARLETHRERLLALLADAGLTPRARAAADPAPVPGEATITAHYHLLHRDWGWEGEGNRECEEAAEAVAEVVSAPLGAMLVLGAGAVRLTRDLHVAHGATTTVALDRNPLPFLVAERILRGETVHLFEFPLRAPASDAVVVDRALATAGPPPENLHLLFADGLDPPVADGAFDTVLTPWFIDQVPADLATLIPTIRRVLRTGGRWVSFGPLIYHPSHTRLAHRYCYDELLELVAREGFEVERESRKRMQYLGSPAGCEARIESVYTFSARMTAASPEGAAPEEPPWLADTSAPVPRLAGLEGYTPPHPLFGAVIALVDGNRSIADIARILIERHGLPKDAALPGVQSALREIARAVRR